MAVPAYHTGGWYDIFLEGTLKNFERLSKLYPKTRHYLTVGPWTHNTPSDRKYGKLDFGATAALDPDEELIAWADLVLKGIGSPLVNRAPVKVFVMGENIWREEHEWPLRRALSKSYYLHASRSALSLSGDGLLTENIPEEERHDEFVYDPRNPVPTTGGPLCCIAEQESGPFDQSEVETRSDVLVYSTLPLPRPLEVTGPVRVVLYVGSNATDTDFTAKLVDVYPNGKAYNLTDGILRMRHRESLTTVSSPIEKDQIYRIEVDLIATSNLFQKGHRIRLEISSSNFPRFDRNLNTGNPLMTGYQMRIARNRVFNSKVSPSALILPVVPRRSDG